MFSCFQIPAATSLDYVIKLCTPDGMSPVRTGSHHTPNTQTKPAPPHARTTTPHHSAPHNQPDSSSALSLLMGLHRLPAGQLADSSRDVTERTLIIGRSALSLSAAR
jgi:hypothetical protein